MGTIFGSFYNLVALRVPKKISIVKPNSHCDYCNHELKWYELIPIISFLLQKGKCRNCHTKLSWLYPFTEMATGLLFLVSYYSFGFSYDLLIALTLVSTFILVIVSDLNYLIIPDRFILLPSIIVLVITILDKGVLIGLRQLGYGLLCFLIMYLIMLIGNKLFKKESLGGADIKLMFLVGLTLDPLLFIIVVFLASIFALPIALFLLYKNREHIIPFGPFLVFGLLVVFFTKLSIQEILSKMLMIF